MTGLALLQRSFAAVLRAGSAYNDAMADDAVTRVIAAMPGDLAASQRIVNELGINGVKYACDFNGYFGGHPRSPLTAPSRQIKDEIEVLLSGIRS